MENAGVDGQRSRTRRVTSCRPTTNPDLYLDMSTNNLYIDLCRLYSTIHSQVSQFHKSMFYA